MMRRASCVLVVALALVAGAAPAYAVTASPNSPTSGQLVEAPATWDGTSVTFTGEAIGEVMRRGDHAWIHLNDDAYYLENVEEGAELGGYNSGHAVWLPAKLAEQVTVCGDYKHEGDVVRVTGVFNAACAEHGGDMDIHAEQAVVVTPGHDAKDPIHPNKIPAAIVLVVLATVLGVVDARALPRRGRGYRIVRTTRV